MQTFAIKPFAGSWPAIPPATAISSLPEYSPERLRLRSSWDLSGTEIRAPHGSGGKGLGVRHNRAIAAPLFSLPVGCHDRFLCDGGCLRCLGVAVHVALGPGHQAGATAPV